MTDETARASRRRLVFEMVRRPDLQGMRAVAVLAVFADHLFGWPSGGFVGVDVFFVLSGFFITGLLLKERSYEGTVSFQNFYIRRVKRILPSALLVLFVTVAGAYALFPVSRAKGTLIDALWAALFAANFRFEAVGADYFQQDLPPSPIQHYWSLSIEEQFYFAWPLLLWLLFLLTRKVYRRGHVWARQWGLFLPMAMVVAASFGWALYLTAANPNAAYFSTFTRVWELGVGALLAIAGPWLTRIPDGLRPALAYVGLGGVAASLFAITAQSRFPGPWAALPVLSTALVVASFHGAQVRAVPMLTNPVSRWFGDTSYTLYLWHWPVILLLAAVIPEGLTFQVVVLALALGLTAVTYRYYEKPIRGSRWLLGPRRVGRDGHRGLEPSRWALIGLLVAAVPVVLLAWFAQADKLATTQQSVESALAVNLAPPPPAESKAGTPALSVVPGNDPCFGAPAIINPSCALRNPGAALTPSVDEFTTDGVGVTCWTEDADTFKTCKLGYTGPDAIRIALVGDSHANRILPGLTPYLEGEKWSLTTYIGKGCVWKKPVSETCPPVGSIEEQLIAENYDLVLTTARRADGDYVNAWRPVIDVGIPVAVIADNPQASSDSLACLTRVTGDAGECGTPQSVAVPDDPQVAAAARLGLPVIDLGPYYCVDSNCPSVIGDVIVYSDASSHVTATYMSTLAPALVNGIRRALT